MTLDRKDPMRTHIRQLTFVLLVCALSAFAGYYSTARASGTGPCSADRYDTRPRMGTAAVARKNAALTRCAARRWHVPGGPDAAVRVFRCESSLYSWAHSNGNYGVAQQRGTYWPTRARHYLRRDWFNDQQWRRVPMVPEGAYLARANILVSIKQVHAGGWGPWSCA